MRNNYIFLLAAIPLIQACAVPRTISVYDEECQVVAKQMVLDVQSANAVASCSSKDCIGQAIGTSVILATTAVVSGSIVVAGNVVYWLEKKRNCQPIKAIPEPALLKHDEVPLIQQDSRNSVCSRSELTAA